MNDHALVRLGFVASLCLGASIAVTGCVGAPEEPESDDSDVAQNEEAATGPTVAQAMANSCSTTSVKGLSLQIIGEGNCIKPGAYAKVPDLGNVSFGSAVFRYLEAPARDKLVSSLNAHKGWSMTVNSMLRTVAQQYLLYNWYKNGKCSIGLAATPGNSNHETGLAIDVSQYSTWKGSLVNHGFKWLGASDAVHFDYVGAGAVSHKGLDVKAFQKLWNRNHPEDKITVDGVWGPQTEARMKKSPANGFAKGPSCAAPMIHDAEACSHDLGIAGAPLDALCSSCSFQVCQVDATCCESSWDQACVTTAADLCGTGDGMDNESFAPIPDVGFDTTLDEDSNGLAIETTHDEHEN